MSPQTKAIRIAVTWTIIYGIGAFIAWEANPAQWHAGGRFAFAILGASCTLTILGSDRVDD